MYVSRVAVKYEGDKNRLLRENDCIRIWALPPASRTTLNQSVGPPELQFSLLSPGEYPITHRTVVKTYKLVSTCKAYRAQASTQWFSFSVHYHFLKLFSHSVACALRISQDILSETDRSRPSCFVSFLKCTMYLWTTFYVCA